jgi:hypothetical protein
MLVMERQVAAFLIKRPLDVVLPFVTYHRTVTLTSMFLSKTKGGSKDCKTSILGLVLALNPAAMSVHPGISNVIAIILVIEPVVIMIPTLV